MELCQSRRVLLAAARGGLAIFLTSEATRVVNANSFEVINLVSDLPGVAVHTDPNLVNPWGIAASPTSPFWIANNGTGNSTLYNGTGQPFTVGTPLVVTIPPAPPATIGSPTGIAFNGGNGFQLVPGGSPARFIFATEDGTISGWNPAVNPTQSILKVIGTDVVYKGLTIGNNGSGDFLYAANFSGGKIDVFDSNFAPVTLAGSFTDPTLPAGFAPFNVQKLDAKLYVTYAQSNGHDDVAGPGNGIVSVFDLNGNLLYRLASGGALNSPWGLAIAPADFGPFAGDLLVGNFGDGRINVYDPVNLTFLDTLRDSNGNPIQIEGLWALTPGNGGNGGNVKDIYFTAGISGDDQLEDHGLFGSISPSSPHVPDGGASTGVLFGITLIGMAAARITSKPTERINSSALLFSTMPGRS